MTNRLRGAHGAHAPVTALLLHWLSNATGQTAAEIFTELVATVDTIAYSPVHNLAVEAG